MHRICWLAYIMFLGVCALAYAPAAADEPAAAAKSNERPPVVLTEAALPLQVHFDLKALLELPEAVMTENPITFYDPVRPGDRLHTHQVLRSVSDEKTTKLGTGRFWVIEVVYHNQEGGLVGVESYTGFGYRRAAS